MILRYFHVLINHSYIFFSKISIEIFCPFYESVKLQDKNSIYIYLLILDTNNELWEREIKKTISRNNLNNKVKDLYTENWDTDERDWNNTNWKAHAHGLEELILKFPYYPKASTNSMQLYQNYCTFFTEIE